MERIVSPLWATTISGWATSLRAGGRAETTIRTRTDHVRWLATWARDRSPWDLTLDDLVEWTGTRAWARETRRSVRTSLRSFYTWGVRSGRIDTNPTTELPSVRPVPPAPKPTPDLVYRAALRSAPPRERLMLRLAAEAGLRRAEVAQVSTRDLVQDLGGWSLVVHGKGSKERLVPLTATIAAEIHTHGPGFIFPGADGGHLSPRWVGKIIARRLPGDWTMHSLRHRFATLAYAHDRDVFTVQDLLGHASPATTRLYVVMPNEAKRAHVAAVAAHDGDTAPESVHSETTHEAA